MKKIIIDTNALMAIGELKIDLFTEIDSICHFKYKLYVLQGSIDELKMIMKDQRGKFKRSAALALSLLKAKKVDILPSEGDVDDVLAVLSHQGALVLTQDRQLKRRLMKPYLTIRQKKKVVMIEGDH